jgi:hypothetical protein
LISIACPFSQHQKVCQEHLGKLQLLKLLPSGINYSLSTFRRCQDSRERGKGNWHWLFTKNHFDVDCLYH